jgi:hypothetical protein
MAPKTVYYSAEKKKIALNSQTTEVKIKYKRINHKNKEMAMNNQKKMIKDIMLKLISCFVVLIEILA